MIEVIKNIIKGIDNQESSKRVVFLYIGVILWSFVHVIIFFAPKDRFPSELPSTLIMYDFVLITGLAGIVLMEKILPKKKDDASQ